MPLCWDCGDRVSRRRARSHLKATIGSRDNTVVIVGFQAHHTLGRRLVERRSRVRIFGVEHERRAEVVVLDGFSAHAGKSELVQFAEELRDRGRLKQVFLVHGEEEGIASLEAALTEHGFPAVHAPERGERIRL